MRSSDKKAKTAASMGASIGASLGGKAGPFGAGIGGGLGGATGYIAGALVPSCGCSKPKLLPDGGQPVAEGDASDRGSDSISIPVTEE